MMGSGAGAVPTSKRAAETIMRLNGVLTSSGAAFVLVAVFAGSARAADGPVATGTQKDGFHVNLDDKKDDKKDENPDQVKLPGGGTCDTTALEARFKVLKVKPDAANRKVEWIMEAKEDITSIVAEATLYDEDEVRIGVAPMVVEPNAYIKKGDHVRFTLTLPADTVMQKVKKISIR
jgi:hypothetical protein